MKRKIVALFMTCTLGATLLTGCGDIASAFSSDDKEDVDENADDESDKKDSDKDAKDGKTDDSSSKASDEKEDDSKDNDGSDAEGLKVPESEEELFAFMGTRRLMVSSAEMLDATWRSPLYLEKRRCVS